VGSRHVRAVRTSRYTRLSLVISPSGAAISAAGGVSEQIEVSAARIDVARPSSAEHHGRAHAVPVSDIVAHSGLLAEALYRGFEIVVASIGLVVAMPLMLTAAVLVRCDSPGPVLFRHKRPARSTIGRGRDLEGRIDLQPPPSGYEADALYYVPSYFTLVKFRTMHNSARTLFPQYYTYKFAPEEFHQQFPTIRYDPRVTRAGRILRKLSVDELPNLCPSRGHATCRAASGGAGGPAILQP
jgi:hypothetical protein